MKRAMLLLAAFLIPPPPALAAPVKPEVVTRAQWGSRPAPIPDSRHQIPAWITVHHAGEIWRAGQDPVDFIRRMQRYGQNRPRIEPPPRNTYWPDLPYHYLIAPDGRIFEGRPVEYEPESNTRYPLNGNIGVEMMGDFNAQRPSLAQLRAVARLTAWLSHAHGIDLDHVRSHKDAAPAQTDCPGKDFDRYFADGSFKNWVRQALAGAEPTIDPAPPLPNGPTAPIP